MKYLFFITIVVLGFWGCSSSINTTSFTPSQRLQYAMKLYDDKDYENSVKEFQAIILQYPGNSVVDTAQYYLGESRYQRGEYIMAAYEFSRLIKNMPASKLVPSAQYMLAESYYQLSPYFALDQRYTKKAIEEFQAFIDFFPTDPKVPAAEKKISEMNNKLAEKEYNNAYIYDKLEDYKAALIYYDLVLDNYHDTKYAPLAMYDKIKLLVTKKRNDEALAAISKFIEKYPNDSHLKEIEKIKSSLEGKLSASK
ncbi:MAG: outer membrane protein assembly factor BamD [Bacteroidetes bacterium]|nr:outer membrane protein assembly factor BamD [Bacteroidota bacterium]